MRVKVLGREDARQVLLVYPTTREEYREALEMLGRAARAGAGHGPARGARGPEHGRYVVTTEEQRHRWGLPDLSAGAGMVGEAQAFEVLCDAAEWSASAVELPAEAGAVLSPGDGEPEELGAVRAFVAPGPRVDRVLAALAGGELPAIVHAILRRALRQALASGSEAVEKALDRSALAVALPWRKRAPARVDPVHLRQALDRTHGGLDRVKSRLVEVLAASRRFRRPAGAGTKRTAPPPSRTTRSGSWERKHSRVTSFPDGSTSWPSAAA